MHNNSKTLSSKTTLKHLTYSVFQYFCLERFCGLLARLVCLVCRLLLEIQQIDFRDLTTMLRRSGQSSQQINQSLNLYILLQIGLRGLNHNVAKVRTILLTNQSITQSIHSAVDKIPGLNHYVAKVRTILLAYQSITQSIHAVDKTLK